MKLNNPQGENIISVPFNIKDKDCTIYRVKEYFNFFLKIIAKKFGQVKNNAYLCIVIRKQH